jgi:hypothetical protein
MPEMSPAAANAALLALAVGLYALVWFASRNLSRFAQVLARVLPISLLFPALLYVAALNAASTSHVASKGAAKPADHPVVQSLEQVKGSPLTGTQRQDASEIKPEVKPAVIQLKPEVTEVKPEAKEAIGEPKLPEAPSGESKPAEEKTDAKASEKL